MRNQTKVDAPAIPLERHAFSGVPGQVGVPADLASALAASGLSAKNIRGVHSVNSILEYLRVTVGCLFAILRIAVEGRLLELAEKYRNEENHEGAKATEEVVRLVLKTQGQLMSSGPSSSGNDDDGSGKGGR